jgi:hypothetical protein
MRKAERNRFEQSSEQLLDKRISSRTDEELLCKSDPIR